MAQTITQNDALLSLANFMGTRGGVPSGDTSDWQRYVQSAFNYAWRYYKWNFSMKTATVTDGKMPADFDLEGYRTIAPINGILQEEVTGEVYAQLTDNDNSFYLQYDAATNRYTVVGAPSTFTVTYQIAPPTLGDTGAPFPDVNVIGQGALIWAKQGENPTHADVKQDWDLFHNQLDELVRHAVKARPGRLGRTRQEVLGAYTGRV